MRRLKAVSALGFLLALSGCGGIGASPDATATNMPSDGPLGRTMNRHAEDFERCGADSVSIQTGSTQHIRMRFIVTADGRATKPSIAGMSDPDPDLQVCLLKVLKRIEFPKPADGLPKPVDYPITLKSG